MKYRISSVIKSRTHPLVRRLRALRRRKHRAREGVFVIEGIKNVGEALRAGIRLQDVLVSARLESHPIGAELGGRLALSTTARIRAASDEVLDYVSDAEADQGIVAVAPITETGLDAAVWRGGSVIVADCIQDPGNLGALVRATEALGGTGLVAVGGADLWGPKAVRATAGSLFRLPVARVTDGAGALAELRRLRYRVVAAVAHEGSEPALLEPPIALIIGSEGRGIDPIMLEQTDGRVTIRLASSVESLNVVAAAAILLDRIARVERCD